MLPLSSVPAQGAAPDGPGGAERPAPPTRRLGRAWIDVAPAQSPRSQVAKVGYTMVEVTINGKTHRVDTGLDTPRNVVSTRTSFGLTGTRFGCGAGLCGCCTVHVNNEATRSCRITLGDLNGSSVTTIETERQRAASSSTSVDRSPGPAMRLLSVGSDHAGRGIALGKSQTFRRELMQRSAGNICRCDLSSHSRRNKAAAYGQTKSERPCGREVTP